MQKLADRLRRPISVCHFPPGTSKWNKIEHRLFSFISQNWRGQPLVSHAVIVNVIAATTTPTGLRVRARVDTNRYLSGLTVSRDALAAIRLRPDSFHGDWNYTILPTHRLSDSIWSSYFAPGPNLAELLNRRAELCAGFVLRKPARRSPSTSADAGLHCANLGVSWRYSAAEQGPRIGRAGAASRRSWRQISDSGGTCGRCRRIPRRLAGGASLRTPRASRRSAPGAAHDTAAVLRLGPKCHR